MKLDYLLGPDALGTLFRTQLNIIDFIFIFQYLVYFELQFLHSKCNLSFQKRIINKKNSVIEFKVMCFRSRRGTGANSLGQSSALANASHIGIHNSAQVPCQTLHFQPFICFPRLTPSLIHVRPCFFCTSNFTSSFSRTLPFTRRTWRTRPSCGCPSRPWRSWTGASTSWRQSRPTDQSPTWLQARYAPQNFFFIS